MQSEEPTQYVDAHMLISCTDGHQEELLEIKQLSRSITFTGSSSLFIVNVM